ncbi:MAG: putative Glycosyltransferase [Nitrospira sp.]|nr:MAG: putative Glycosyltransferase [Nitrospira sp.]
MESTSIVITCYNQAPFIGEAIDSARSQTVPAREILVVDDGSTDQTGQIVGRYADVRYIHQGNQGLVAVTRNRGIQETKGTYIVFLDGDDRLLPKHLETSLKAFQQTPHAAAVCGLFREFGEQEGIISHICDPDDFYGMALRFPSIAHVITAMFKRSILAESGNFCTDPAINGCDDFELFLRLARRSLVHCHHELVAEHRYHSNQTTKNRALMLKSAMTAYRYQRPYILAHPQYTEDYVRSRRAAQDFWGQLSLNQLALSASRGEIGVALQYLGTLLRFFPLGLLHRICRKALNLTIHRNQGHS